MADDNHDNDRDDDHAYLKKAYDEHKKSLYDRARRLSNGRLHDAEDLVQETFCRALTYPMNPHEIRNPRGYLLSVMRNVWITRWKKEQQDRMESLDAILNDPARQKEHPIVESEVPRIAKNAELLQRLKNIQAALSRDDKDLLAARLDGQTLEEIAASLNEDKFRTRARWYKLKAKLNRLIKGGNEKTKGLAMK